jgi:hypothetical protein
MAPPLDAPCATAAVGERHAVPSKPALVWQDDDPFRAIGHGMPFPYSRALLLHRATHLLTRQWDTRTRQTRTPT